MDKPVFKPSVPIFKVYSQSKSKPDFPDFGAILHKHIKNKIKITT